MKTKVGDTAIFNWDGYHNVLIHSSGDCSEDGATYVGATSGALYTFEEKDVGEVVFACNMGRHCEFRKIVTFEVEASTDSNKEPTITSGGCYDIDVHVCGCDLDACNEAKCTANGFICWRDGYLCSYVRWPNYYEDGCRQSVISKYGKDYCSQWCPNKVELL